MSGDDLGEEMEAEEGLPKGGYARKRAKKRKLEQEAASEGSGKKKQTKLSFYILGKPNRGLLVATINLLPLQQSDSRIVGSQAEASFVYKASHWMSALSRLIGLYSLIIFCIMSLLWLPTLANKTLQSK